jgi:hypothetical protein
VQPSLLRHVKTAMQAFWHRCKAPMRITRRKSRRKFITVAAVMLTAAALPLQRVSLALVLSCPAAFSRLSSAPRQAAAEHHGQLTSPGGDLQFINTTSIGLLIEICRDMCVDFVRRCIHQSRTALPCSYAVRHCSALIACGPPEACVCAI